jgi:hypothetical protein
MDELRIAWTKPEIVPVVVLDSLGIGMATNSFARGGLDPQRVGRDDALSRMWAA